MIKGGNKMLSQSGINKETFGAPVQILANAQIQMSVGVVVSNAGAVVVGNKKVIKAGTPLTGSLEARNTAFTAAGEANAVGVLLHDVDVTNGNGNGTLLIFGFVNIDRIDKTTQALITSGVKSTLSGKVTFLK